MGMFKHHAIIVTGSYAEIEAAHNTAFHLFQHKPNLEHDRILCPVSPIIWSMANGYYTFVVGPDGSKEGWEHSNLADDARAQFVAYLRNSRLFEWVEVCYYDEQGPPYIVNNGSVR